MWFGRSIIAVLPTRKSAYKIEYFLGLLNSRYFEWLYQKLVHERHRVFAQVKLSKIKQLPIRCIDFNNPAEKKMHDDLVALADKMLELKKQFILHQDIWDSQREVLLKEIDQTDKQIDKLIYELYGLTEDEIKKVESQAV